MTAPSDRLIRQWLPKRLQQAQSPLPRSAMSPSLSYGRHRGPHPSGARHAAVLIAIYKDNDDRWLIPLTRRPESLQHHGGQICLPGGRLEPGESPKDAAVREFEEELGLRPQQIIDCGELDTQYVYNSNNRVHPVVVLVQRPQEPWCPDPVEVDEVILLPIATLLDPISRQEMTKRRLAKKQGMSVGEFHFRAPAFDCDNHQIWGATAVILDQFAMVLHQLHEDHR